MKRFMFSLIRLTRVVLPRVAVLGRNGFLKEAKTMPRGLMLPAVTVLSLLALTTATAKGAVVRQSNLVGWWQMGEGATWNGSSWTVPDASGAGNTGTSARMLQSDEVSGYPFNPYSGTSEAMQFNGASGSKYIGTSYSPSLAITSSFTLSAWVRQDTQVWGDAMIVDRCDPGLVHNYLLQLEDGRASVCFYDDYYLNQGGWPWPKINGATTLNTNQWYSVAGVFDNTAHTLTVYVNGVQDGQMSVLGSPVARSLQGVAIGGEAAENACWFNGKIDDVRIYNTALSASEMAALYNSGRGDFLGAPQPTAWAAAVSGNWTSASNWTQGAPNAIGAGVTINASTTAALTITLNAAQTVGTLLLGNSGAAGVGYTLTGTGSNSLTLNNSGSGATITVTDGTHAINAPLVLNDNLTVTNSGSLALGGVIANGANGPKGITTAGNGQLVLAGLNTYSGDTTIGSGTVTLAHRLAVQNSTVNVNSGGILTFATGITSPSLGGLTGSGSIALRTAASQPITLTLGSNGQSTTYSGVLSGTGGLTKTGSGRLTLAGADTFSSSGGVTINQGTLSAPLGIPHSGSAVTLAAGATLEAGGQVKRAVSGTGAVTATNDLILGSSTQAGQFNLGGVSGVGGTLNIGGNAVAIFSADTAILGSQTTLGNGGSLTTLKGSRLGNSSSLDTTKVLTATGNATMNGNFVNNGVVHGPTGSGQRLTFTQFVQGAGSTTGNVEYAGSYSPGNSPASVSVENVILDPISTLIMEISGPLPATGYDQLDISGAAILDGTLDVTLLNGFTPSQGQIFDLFNGTTIGHFTHINLPTLGNGLTWNTTNLYTTGVVHVVPEPSTFALLGVGAIALATFTWRRQRKST